MADEQWQCAGLLPSDGLEVGCGGHCGTLSDEEFSESYGEAVRKGYACDLSDAGHKGMVVDGLWAYGDPQAMMDWGYRAPHVAALAGKAITQLFYRQTPAHSPR